MLPSFCQSYRARPPLPDGFGWHSVWFVIAFTVYIGLSVLRSRGIQVPLGVALTFGTPAWCFIAVYLIYYIAAYPIIHAGKRYDGGSQTAWLIMLSLELCGFGFGLVRLFYLFFHIIPDARHQPPYDKPGNA